ncbi:MAG: metallophosphoesterase, partial [Candidatus Saccharimonadales bacterium]
IKPQEFVNKAWGSFTAELPKKVALKQPDEFRVGIISDMHDNAFMADLAGKTLNAFDVDGMIVAGDSTASGLKYEQFITKAIVNNTEGIEFRGDVLGNHDTEASQQPFRDADFIDLNDGQVKAFGPLTVMGIQSNQYTALGRDTVELGPKNDEVAQRVADTACEQDNPVNMVVGHEPQRGDRVVAQACTELFVAAHMHDQINPTPITGDSGTNVYRMINGTTGGAESAFTYGEPINPADITFLTYKIGFDGTATFDGWQHVRYIRSGRAEVSDYTQVAPAITSQQLSRERAVPIGVKQSLK